MYLDDYSWCQIAQETARLDRASLLNLIHTNRHFYNALSHCLLLDTPVVHLDPRDSEKSERRLEGFHSFILGKETRQLSSTTIISDTTAEVVNYGRGQSLHRLWIQKLSACATKETPSLGTVTLSDRSIQMLKDVLSCAPNLIEFHIDASYYHEDISVILPPISSHPLLKKLSLGVSLTPETIHQIQNLQPSITHLSIHTLALSNNDGFQPVIKPAEYLRQLSSSLRLLRVCVGEGVRLELTDNGHSFDSMAHLALKALDLDLSTKTLATLYPNLRSLELYLLSNGRSRIIDGAQLFQRRIRNITNSRCWKNLDYICGNPIPLYTLGLSCTARVLSLACHCFPGEGDAISTLCKSLKPGYLHMMVPLPNQYPILIRTIRGSTDSVLNYNLEVLVDMNKLPVAKGGSQLGTLLGDAVAAFDETSVENVTIQFHLDGHWETEKFTHCIDKPNIIGVKPFSPTDYMSYYFLNPDETIEDHAFNALISLSNVETICIAVSQEVLVRPGGTGRPVIQRMVERTVLKWNPVKLLQILLRKEIIYPDFGRVVTSDTVLDI
ncbi:hypothetical protein QCA50_007238 [Cerrena zonata]|uniref:Uncharacterized protein n=1 Tax=Cerrena zonata TaxID=2478898 RepID=A0AAW0GJ09_9APHY